MLSELAALHFPPAGVIGAGCLLKKALLFVGLIRFYGYEYLITWALFSCSRVLVSAPMPFAIFEFSVFFWAGRFIGSRPSSFPPHILRGLPCLSWQLGGFFTSQAGRWRRLGSGHVGSCYMILTPVKSLLGTCS